MKEFIQTRFYELPDDADIEQAYEEFEKDRLHAEVESFAYDNELDVKIVLDIFADYSFSGFISDENIRKRLIAYHFGLLKITKLTGDIKTFVVNTYAKYKAEGE